jgi:hypothetical protein
MFVESGVQTDPFLVKLVEICKAQAEEIRDAKLNAHGSLDKCTKLQDDLKLTRRECDDLKADAKKIAGLMAELQNQLRWERESRAKREMDSSGGPRVANVGLKSGLAAVSGNMSPAASFVLPSSVTSSLRGQSQLSPSLSATSFRRSSII